MIEELKNSILELLDDQKELSLKVKDVLKDKSLPLDKRWEIYLIVEKTNILSEDRYGDGFIDVLSDKLTIYDDFYYERHQTIYFSDILEIIKEEWNEHLSNIPKESIEKWKETVLESGLGSFVYNW